MKTINELLGAMTAVQKVRQMSQFSINFYQSEIQTELTGPLLGFTPDDELRFSAGSIIGILSAEMMREVLEKYNQKNSDGIPAVVMADVIHGYRTIFPIPLAMRCSWNCEDVELACRIAAIEASACGIHVTFAPMADLVRDPRWGRVMESTGEDPYLNGKFAEAAVRGFQNGDVAAPDSLASCVKHFAGYGAPEAGREYNTVDMSEGVLREFYLSGYQKAIEAGCELVMTAFNTVDRVPATCNSWLLETLLRSELGFDGVVISDWNSIDELIAHGVAQNGSAAALKALRAGVDIDMMSGHYFKYLDENSVRTEALVDHLNESVARVLRLKERLGLFHAPLKGLDAHRAETLLLCAEHREAARKVAEDSIVLLENDGILPIHESKTIGIFGSLAETDRLLGNWSCEGKNEECVTLRRAFEGRRCKLLGQVDSTDPGVRDDQAVACDVAIVVTGEDQDTTGESTSRTSLELPEQDIDLVKELRRKGIPTIVVVHSGRPLMLERVSGIANGLVQAWFLGSESGNALADLLLGRISPQGRLTMTFPRNVGQIPIYYNAYKTGRPKQNEDDSYRYVSKYIDCSNSPLYPFGYGLLYTEMDYSGLKLSKKHLRGDEILKISVTVCNIGTREGTETVQLYIRDEICSVVRPVMELKAFQKVNLEAGQKQTIDFWLTAKDLAFYAGQEGWITEEGSFTVMVGSDVAHTLKEEFFWEE